MSPVANKIYFVITGADVEDVTNALVMKHRLRRTSQREYLEVIRTYW